jgi:hypothetical protein
MKFRTRERAYSQVYSQEYALRHVLTDMFSWPCSQTCSQRYALRQTLSDRFSDRLSDRLSGQTLSGRLFLWDRLSSAGSFSLEQALFGRLSLSRAGYLSLAGSLCWVDRGSLRSWSEELNGGRCAPWPGRKVEWERNEGMND